MTGAFSVVEEIQLKTQQQYGLYSKRESISKPAQTAAIKTLNTPFSM